MNKIQVRMLTSIDQLQAGQEYFLPTTVALQMIERGQAVRCEPKFEAPQAGPSELKPVQPSSQQVIKSSPKGRKRA